MYAHDFSRFNKFYPGIVSSIDHVFSSPPTRLIDSHSQLINKNAYLFVHDTNKPNPKRYRSEMILDSGIYSEKKPEFCLFSAGKAYLYQQTKQPNLDEQKNNLKIILNSNVFGFSTSQKDLYISRFERISAIYSLCANEKVAWKFYRKYLSNIYDLLGLTESGRMIKTRMINFLDSENYINFLCHLILSTEKELHGIDNLLKNQVFTKQLFRNSKIENVNIIRNIDYLKAGLLNKELIPSYEVYLWSFFLADIKHFGNDLGFAERINKFYPNSLLLQQTKEKSDGVNFIKFSDNFSYGLSNQRRIRIRYTKHDMDCNGEKI
jgi:hypothetical protein